MGDTSCTGEDIRIDIFSGISVRRVLDRIYFPEVPGGRTTREGAGLLISLVMGEIIP